MQYYVPQFIEMESKVIGPLSLRQFFLIAAPCVIVIVFYFIFKSLLIAIILGGGLILAGVGFAFFKFEGQNLTSVFGYGINYFLKPKEYIWLKKGEESVSLKEIKKVIEKKEKIVPKIRSEKSRLKQLSWQIQTQPKKDLEIEQDFRTLIEKSEESPEIKGEAKENNS
jgi:hypothetical protein